MRHLQKFEHYQINEGVGDILKDWYQKFLRLLNDQKLEELLTPEIKTQIQGLGKLNLDLDKVDSGISINEEFLDLPVLFSKLLNLVIGGKIEKYQKFYSLFTNLRKIAKSPKFLEICENFNNLNGSTKVTILVALFCALYMYLNNRDKKVASLSK